MFFTPFASTLSGSVISVSPGQKWHHGVVADSKLRESVCLHLLPCMSCTGRTISSVALAWIVGNPFANAITYRRARKSVVRACHRVRCFFGHLRCGLIFVVNLRGSHFIGSKSIRSFNLISSSQINILQRSDPYQHW